MKELWKNSTDLGFFPVNIALIKPEIELYSTTSNNQILQVQGEILAIHFPLDLNHFIKRSEKIL